MTFYFWHNPTLSQQHCTYIFARVCHKDSSPCPLKPKSTVEVDAQAGRILILFLSGTQQEEKLQIVRAKQQPPPHHHPGQLSRKIHPSALRGAAPRHPRGQEAGPCLLLAAGRGQLSPSSGCWRGGRGKGGKVRKTKAGGCCL